MRPVARHDGVMHYALKTSQQAWIRNIKNEETNTDFQIKSLYSRGTAKTSLIKMTRKVSATKIRM